MILRIQSFDYLTFVEIGASGQPKVDQTLVEHSGKRCLFSAEVNLRLTTSLHQSQIIETLQLGHVDGRIIPFNCCKYEDNRAYIQYEY